MLCAKSAPSLLTGTSDLAQNQMMTLNSVQSLVSQLLTITLLRILKADNKVSKAVKEKTTDWN